MLTGKQKRFLRAEAHHLTPIFQVGKRAAAIFSKVSVPLVG